jgi:hypothetical protein
MKTNGEVEVTLHMLAPALIKVSNGRLHTPTTCCGEMNLPLLAPGVGGGSGEGGKYLPPLANEVRTSHRMPSNFNDNTL